MGETVHYKGVLTEMKKLEGEALEEQCKRLVGGKDIPSYYESYEEYLTDEYYDESTVQNGILYNIKRESIEPYYEVFNANKGENGEIEFEVRYYDGGCGFNEAIEEALKNVK